jgi:hypothetical protein
MLASVASHLRHNVVAYLALFIALGGTSAYAANQFTGADIVDSSLTGADIEDLSIHNHDIAKNSITGADVKDRELSRADYTSYSGVTVTVRGVSAPANSGTPQATACMPITVDAPGVNVGDIGLVEAVMDSTAPDNMIVANEVQRTAGKLSWRACATHGSFSHWSPKFSLTALR